MEESSEENIKTVKSISIPHKIAACETNLNNENRIGKNLKIHVESPKTGFVSFCQKKYLSPSLLTDLQEKKCGCCSRKGNKILCLSSEVLKDLCFC